MTVTTNPPGLRERKKAATRQALHEAAVRLAAEHGVEHVTVEAIADAANVSRRTFSNYFASKERALLHTDYARVGRLIELVRDRPAGEAAWTALTRAIEASAAENADEDPEWRARYRTLRRDPALAGELVSSYAVAERELAGVIAGRLPASPDAPLRARLLAAHFLAAVRVANQMWLEHPDEPLADVVRQALATTAEPFT
ncbi:TetR family transcriptional regulator [Phytohabitans sp. ZYX-F-186]|uniref:TetR family transcriptional regulator n=1 Tax=Phytohabitans maris TaxID=3071409 RepID=A0ABU0ZR63_9ACTN|nr:TetR family transcriptional regulator [Phytohabitans sp. ZYX-F-186]MDQ7909490.1 TetR family transcriptional regulator [Phytohabitans sp. ZYX-F-186]